jgi:hypothetical protein
MRVRGRLAILAAVLVAAVALVVPAVASAASAPYCGITWGSAAKAAGSLHNTQLTNVRAGEQACFDRVVFDFAIKANGYRVEYASTVYSEGGAPLNVPGGAKLSVHLLSPSDGYGMSVGAKAANVTGFRTLRSVVYGGTFEGYTTFGVGTRARLPFRVFVLDGPGTGSRIVLDVAHQW